MKNNSFTVSNFYCTKCGQQGIPVVRLPKQQREKGHLKKMWCRYCNEETNHTEVRPDSSYTKEDFQEEFELGRFIEGERIPESELLRCSKEGCKYNREGKCWNSNFSYSCSHRIGRTNYE